ncbi:hypothetical protein NUU61_000104 [Penicillium alfredii]|uniref:Short chain dehydrogenase/reductase n=1 Tax=Penicillium alfredii TaxID=1506179 RepID=A0A9W9KQB4_9EURO|nr:uncharacterized protein NUU61_000104 [Penicillium alfredii]KAJ5114345.1 hypothetical protein NUU61_000104 [Penicillium alfredii]
MTLGTWTQSLSYIGLATLAYITLKFTRQATTFLLPTTLTKRYNNNADQPNWALVTGATDGIGLGFSQELCARGFNVILHGRNRAKLEQRQRELRAEFPERATAIIVCDVQEISATKIDNIANEVQTHLRTHDGSPSGSLTVLVNNVGGETRPSTLLTEYSFFDVEATIHRNLVFTTHITRVLLPLLHSGGRPGLVLNVSSIAAVGMPYITVYSGSKGFVDSFTRSLRAEVSAEGLPVEVMALRVGEVRTAGYDIAPSLFVPTGRTLAAAGLNRVGSGQDLVWGYFWHWVQGVSFDVLPRWMLMTIAEYKLKALRKGMQEKAKKT